MHGKDYKFVSIDEFEELIKLGCFVQTNMYNGQWYGLSNDSIENVAAEGLASVVNMELEVSGGECVSRYLWPRVTIMYPTPCYRVYNINDL